MKWNTEDGFVDYTSSLELVKTILGINIVDFEIRPELAPYLTYTMKYLSKELVLLGDTDIKEKLQKIFDIHSDGADLIVDNSAETLADLIGIDTIPVEIETELEINYNQDRFIFTWTNVLSCLVTRLKIMYANLLEDPISQGCPCERGIGETQKDWEKYTSGVWPKDEEYSNYSLETTASWRVTSPTPECTCKYRMN
jgi:hypothetical protein